MTKKWIWVIIVILILLIVFPKPYDVVGTISGEPPGPWRCLGYSFSPSSNGPPIADAGAIGFCVGIIYK